MTKLTIAIETEGMTENLCDVEGFAAAKIHILRREVMQYARMQKCEKNIKIIYTDD